MSEQSLARAVLAWMDVPLDQDGGTFVELEAMARAALSTPPTDDLRELIDHLNGLMDSLDESVSHDQVYEQLRVAWNMALALRPGVATPPADDVREASGSTLRLDINPLDAWTVDEWAQAMDEERARQIKAGYDDAHDVEHGIPHLLNWSIEYARLGRGLAAATLARCALRLLPVEVRPRGTVTDAEVDAALASLADSAECYYGHTMQGVRAALEAAREVRL